MRRPHSLLIRPLFQFSLLAVLFWTVCFALNLPLQVDWLSAVYWTVVAPWIACAALLVMNRNERVANSSARSRGQWVQTASAFGTRRSSNNHRRSNNRRRA